MRHFIFSHLNGAGFPAWSDKVNGVKQYLGATNTPTVGASTDFQGGGGFAAQIGTTDAFVLNTADQVLETQILAAEIEYYTGNAVRPKVHAVLNKRNVNGRHFYRPELWMTNDASGAAWNFNTTNLPSGQLILIRLLMALR